jgi:hypothetical protein
MKPTPEKPLFLETEAKGGGDAPPLDPFTGSKAQDTEQPSTLVFQLVHRIVMLEEKLTNVERRLKQIEWYMQPIGNIGNIGSITASDLPPQAIQWSSPTASDPIPVHPTDFSARVLTDGSPVTDEALEVNPDTGLQKDYVVLTAEERAKGYRRPVRTTYRHLTCGMTTTMMLPIAETYAREPSFYTGTYCAHCRGNHPVGEYGQYVWLDGTKVGT